MDEAVITYLTNVRSDLEQAPRGERRRIVERAASFLGAAPSTIYRQLRELGWDSGRARRADRGHCAVTKEHAQAVATIMNSSRSAQGLIRMPATVAVDIAKANGQIPPSLSVDAIRRAMIAHRCHPELTERRTHTSCRSLHPNHVWQFDPSICVLYYLDHGGLAAMSERAFCKNKPENVARVAKDRVLRYVITDHATGALFVRYYQAPGERVEILFEFLMEAFNERPGQMLHGVPWHLIWDKGSANTSHAIQNVLDALAVDHWAHQVGNSRAKGQVESAQWLVERQFESRLALMQVRDLAHLNRLADDWQIDFCSRVKHSRTGHTRYGLWQTIRPEQLRMPPPREVCQALLTTKPETRKVQGNLTIRYTVRGCEPAIYSVAHVDGVIPGDLVRVTVNPYATPNIYVIAETPEGRARHIECEPVAMDRFGVPVDAPVLGQEYRATRETEADAERKRQDIATWGSADTGDIERAKTKREPAMGGTVDPFADVAQRKGDLPEHIRRPGTELHVPNPVQVDERPLTHIEALRMLRRRLNRPLTAEENATVRAEYPDGVPEDAIAELAARLIDPPARPALSLVSGGNP